MMATIELPDERKARLFDEFMGKIMACANVEKVVEVLAQGHSSLEDIFYQHGNEDGLERLLVDLFDSMLADEARMLFKKYLPALLCKELDAENVTMTW